ncbi:MAG: hypothetical protein AAF433_15450 [Bacteroidota bacterium]
MLQALLFFGFSLCLSSPLHSQNLPQQGNHRWQQHWHLNFYPVPEMAACDSLPKAQRWNCAYRTIRRQLQSAISAASPLPDFLTGAVLLSWQLKANRVQELCVEQSLHPVADRKSLAALGRVLRRLRWTAPIPGVRSQGVKYYIWVEWCKVAG